MKKLKCEISTIPHQGKKVINNNIRLVLIYIAFILATSCTPSLEKPFPISASPSSEKSIGHEENIYMAWEKGIGGTGISDGEKGIGGTGIVGTISAFGSIVVNGIHIKYNPQQTVESVIGNKLAASLSIGQVVAVEAIKAEQDYVAKRIIEQVALVGEVESINISDGSIEILGETILIHPNNVTSSLSIQKIKVGDQLAISGLRNVTHIYSTYISKTSRNVGNILTGNITSIQFNEIELDHTTSLTVDNDLAKTLKLNDYVAFRDVIRKEKKKRTSNRPLKIYSEMLDDKVFKTATESFFTPGEINQKSNFKRNKSSKKIIFRTRVNAKRSRTNGFLEFDPKDWRKKPLHKKKNNTTQISDKKDKEKEKNETSQDKPTKGKKNKQNQPIKKK